MSLTSEASNGQSCRTSISVSNKLFTLHLLDESLKDTSQAFYFDCHATTLNPGTQTTAYSSLFINAESAVVFQTVAGSLLCLVRAITMNISPLHV